MFPTELRNSDQFLTVRSFPLFPAKRTRAAGMIICRRQLEEFKMFYIGRKIVVA